MKITRFSESSRLCIETRKLIKSLKCMLLQSYKSNSIEPKKSKEVVGNFLLFFSCNQDLVFENVY